MLNRKLTSSILGAAVISLSLIGCGRDDTTTTTSNTPGPAERTGQSIDNAARNTGNAAADAANRTGAAADRAANNAANSANSAMNTGTGATGNTGMTGSTGATGTTGSTANNNTSSVPGMPSVQGTDTSNMSTADAAAQRLIDNARNNIKQNDVSKAKTLLSELQQKGMYDSLSATQKANVDKLAQEINSAPGATAQENK